MVEGEFRMDGPPGAETTKASLLVHCRGSGSERKFESGPLPLGSAPAWIATKLAASIAATVSAEQPLDIDAQIRLFLPRADEFLRLGAVEQALPLRESILLLKPGLAEQRLLLFDERVELIARTVPLGVDEVYPGSPGIRAGYGRKVDLYLQTLEDLQGLIESRQIDRARPWLVGKLPSHGTRIVKRIGEQHYYCIGQEEWCAARSRRGDFIWKSCRKFSPCLRRRAEASGPPNIGFLREWQRTFLSGVASRTDVPYLIVKDLRDLARAYTEILPDDLPIDSLALPGPGWDDGPRAATEDDFADFYRTLAESRHRTSSLRGRYATLSQEFAGPHDARGCGAAWDVGAGHADLSGRLSAADSARAALAFIERARRLQDAYLKLPCVAGRRPGQGEGGWQDLVRLRRGMEQALEPDEPMQIHVERHRRAAGSAAFHARSRCSPAT